MDRLSQYRAFIRAKCKLSADHGFDVSPADVHPSLKEHQKLTVCWAVRGGRRAIFANFGLGKTRMQLETLRLILKNAHAQGQTRQTALIVAPRYFLDGCAYLKAAERELSMPDLFSTLSTGSDGAPQVFNRTEVSQPDVK